MASPGDLAHCPICLEVYDEPRALPCLHTFCDTCLQEFINAALRTAPGATGFECPVCRRHTDPPGSVKHTEWSKLFPLNHIIVSLIDSREDLIPTKRSKGHVESETRTERRETNQANINECAKSVQDEFDVKKDVHKGHGNNSGDSSTDSEPPQPHPPFHPPEWGTSPVPPPHEWGPPPHHHFRPPPHRHPPPHHGPPGFGHPFGPPPPHHRGSGCHRNPPPHRCPGGRGHRPHGPRHRHHHP